MNERDKIIPAAFLLLKKGEEILLQRRYNTGFQDGKYTFISGHVDKGESPRHAICREAMEEAGILVKEEDLRFEQVLFRRSFSATDDGFESTEPDRVDIFFSTDKWEGEPHITEPDKCDDLSWFSLSELPVNTFPIVRNFLKHYPNSQPYDEAGFK